MSAFALPNASKTQTSSGPDETRRSRLDWGKEGTLWSDKPRTPASPPAPTPYQAGYHDGSEGTPYQRDQYRKDQWAQERYTCGWLAGYRKVLAEEVTAYNRLHGTVYQPREGAL